MLIWFLSSSPLQAVLYSFRAFVGKSSIPGAGYGAFLEFTGARRLNEQSNARRDRLITELVVYEPKTMQPLQAVPEDGGSGVTVLLKGENLHGNYNRLYWPSNARKVLKARILYEAVCKNTVFSKATEKVRIVGEHIHDVLEYEAFSVNQSGSLQPIGHFGIQVACDYVKDPTIRTFFTGVNCIDLGRYGPFRNKGKPGRTARSNYLTLDSPHFSLIHKTANPRTFLF